MSIQSEALMMKLNAMSPAELEERRRQIVASARGDYDSLKTEDLQELSYVTATLRRRNAGPPKATKAAKPKATLDSLLDL
jgi:hypothetical protein